MSLWKKSAELESWGEALRAYRARRAPLPSDWGGITKIDQK